MAQKANSSVNDPFHLIYGDASTRSESTEALTNFLKPLLPPSDRKEIPNELKKTFMLKRFKGRKKIKTPQPVKRVNGSVLNAGERRELGLYHLPRKGLKFEDFSAMHDLWLGYMEELIDWSRFQSGDESFQIKLCRADYHGALMKVTKAGNPALVGIEGYVIMDTKNTLQILTKENVLKVVPKAKANFSFAFDGYLVTLCGSAIRLKPAERATKKWKMRTMYEM